MARNSGDAIRLRGIRGADYPAREGAKATVKGPTPVARRLRSGLPSWRPAASPHPRVSTRADRLAFEDGEPPDVPEAMELLGGMNRQKKACRSPVCAPLGVAQAIFLGPRGASQAGGGGFVPPTGDPPVRPPP